MHQQKHDPGIITMAGEPVRIIVGAECLESCTPAIGARLPTILSRLRETLISRHVSRFFINEVRIGNTISLVDKETGFAYRLRMGLHSVCVLGIYQNQEPPENTPVVYFVNERLLHLIKCGKAVAA